MILFLLLQSLLVYAQIKHVIVLMEENRSFDHFCGWFPGVDGLTGDEYNLVNQSDPNSQKIFVDSYAKWVALCDPDHSLSATTAKVFGIPATNAGNFSQETMSGFVEWEGMRGNEGTNYCGVMSAFTPEDLPVLAALASEFVIMDRFFTALPGPTWPNRLYMLSGTSAGLTETGYWYQGQVGQFFPQPTIFDQVASEGLQWRHYFNDTPWELMLSSVVHNPENVQPMEQFWEDAATGNLPSFAWINPRAGVNFTSGLGSSDDHPDHDVALGEQYYKDIYEALRASPQWNETLFIITFDEHGGFYDHVPPPMNVPPPDNIPSYPDVGVEFNRLGVRIPTLLISPLVPKGLVLSDPPPAQQPYPDSAYTLTSIIASARKLLGMKSGPLTKRDAWSATFEQIFNLSEPRTDCPQHLPNAPPPSATYSVKAEAALPINGLQEYIMQLHANVLGEKYPEHIQYQGQMSEWAQNKFLTHVDRHQKWKAYKQSSEYELLVQPGASSNWGPYDWYLNPGDQVPYSTLSVDGDTLCLDYNTTSANMTVNVSPCYPSFDPDTNRDPSQQWTWGPDAMIRAYANPSLCLTTHFPEGDPRLYMEPCNIDRVQQHFAYEGGQNFGSGSGRINWSVYSLGLVANTTN